MSPILLLAALLPAGFLMRRVYRLDTIEKEPSDLLWRLVLMGALSAIPAATAEMILGRILGRFVKEGSTLYLALENFIVVAGSEELFKRWPVRKTAWNHPAFNYRFDAVVYCVYAALGFAALENVLYVARFGFSVAVSRALLSVPGHFFFAVYMGIFLGESKLAEHMGDYRRSRRKLRQGLIVPMILHGFWDFSLSTGSPAMTAAFYAFVILFFLIADKSLHRASDTDQPV